MRYTSTERFYNPQWVLAALEIPYGLYVQPRQTNIATSRLLAINRFEAQRPARELNMDRTKF